MYELGMFPLEHTVLPGATIPLHIFESRYRALAESLRESAEPEFGIVLIERGREVGGEDQRVDVGVVARVLEAEELPDGRWVIVAVATRRIRVDEWLGDDPYPRARVSDWPDESIAVEPSDLDGLAEAIKRLYSIARRRSPSSRIDDPPIDHDDPGIASWQAVRAAQLGPLDNLALLSEPTCAKRVDRATRLINERAEFLDALGEQRG